MKTITLTKGKHRFRIRYEVGQEAFVLYAIIAMVNRPEVDFDWFDAAVLLHQIGSNMAKELKAFALPGSIA